jgi:hypothetical protein
MWYFGTPTRLPARSLGVAIPALAPMKIDEWRKLNDGKTGTATSGSPRPRSTVYVDSESSETSNSRNRAIR